MALAKLFFCKIFRLKLVYFQFGYDQFIRIVRIINKAEFVKMCGSYFLLSERNGIHILYDPSNEND